MKKPAIIWKGKTKQTATVQGHRVGFVEEWVLNEVHTAYRWDSRYSEDGWRPNFDTMEEAKNHVENCFYDWFNKVIAEITS